MKLGLTATPPKHREHKMEFLKEHCPILYTIDLDKGVALKASAEYDTYNIPVRLTDTEQAVYNM